MISRYISDDLGISSDDSDKKASDESEELISLIKRQIKKKCSWGTLLY